MINPDAKCVVNGSKVNDVIIALNPLLNMDIIIGDVTKPEIKQGPDGLQIVIPSPESYTNEELDVVDSSNTASTRWFLTSTSQGSASSADASTKTVNATPGNRSMPVAPQKGRDKLQREGGGQNNRDQLNTVTGGGEGVKGGALKAPPDLSQWRKGGALKAPLTGGGGAFGGGTDAFGNELHADGSRVTPGGMGGALKAPLTGGGDLADDGLTAAQAGAQFRARKGAPPLTGDGGFEPPKPGAPPLTGDGGFEPPKPGAPPLTGNETVTTGDDGGGFSPGSRDYRAMQLNNPEQFAAMEQADKAAMMNDLPTLSSYLQAMGNDLKKHNPSKYQALRKREAELNRELIRDDLQALNSQLDVRGPDLKKYNPKEYKKLRARQAELSKKATQGRQ